MVKVKSFIYMKFALKIAKVEIKTVVYLKKQPEPCELKITLNNSKCSINKMFQLLNGVGRNFEQRTDAHLELSSSAYPNYSRRHPRHHFSSSQNKHIFKIGRE